VLRDDPRTVAAHGRKAGVLLSGLGGVGKSAVAGRVMARVSELGWTPVVMVGRWGLGELAMTIGAQLVGHQEEALDRLGRMLVQTNLPDAVRQQQLHALPARYQVLLVLDNFEDNLALGGRDFRDAITEDILLQLLQAAQRGKLLVTSRYPLPRRTMANKQI